MNEFPDHNPTGTESTLSPDGMTWPLALAIVALVLLAYLPAMRAGFVWDDDHHFTAVPAMTEPGGLARLWTGHQFYYPLTSTTWWVMRRMVGLEPLAYHLLTILLHAANALLVWRLLRELRIDGAWLAAALFAVHPVAVQSVAWATELKNTQSTLFFLLALLAYLRFDERGRRGWYAAALGCFVLALLSKTSTVTLPLVLPLLHAWRRRPWTWRAAAWWAPWFALAAAAGLTTLALHAPQVTGPEWDLAPIERLSLAGRCVWFYLGKLVWPAPLSFVYPRWEIDATKAMAWLSLVALFALVSGLWMLRRRAWGWAALLALGWFVANLLPVLNFFPMYYARYSFVADHWQYLAMIGPLAWAAGVATWLARRWSTHAAGVAVAVVLVALAGLSFRQATHYRDNVTLFHDVLRKNPTGEIGYNVLAMSYAKRLEYPTAETVVRAGLRRHPDDPRLLTILGGVLLDQSRPAEALDPLRRALAVETDDVEILNNLGRAHAELGRTDEAVAFLRRALTIEPDFPPAWTNLVATLANAGRAEAARDALDEALLALPNEPILLDLRSRLDAAER